MNSSSATVGANNFPPTYTYESTNPTTANCAGGANPDFVVYNTGVAGSSSQASIIAYDNLYSGLCSGAGTVPQTYWAYNTGGTIETAVAQSLDGTQLAFVHSASTSSLVLLKWAAGKGTASSPTTLTPVANNLYKGCMAPCMTTISFGRTDDDTLSSPFYDLVNDNIYIGGATGYIYGFTHVFLGLTTPALGWSVQVASKNVVASPVYDPVSGYVYTVDYTSNVDELTPSGTLVAQVLIPGPTGGNNQDDIQEGPIVDPTAEKVYIFGEGKTTNYVAQVQTNFTSSSPVTYATVGSSANSDTEVLYAGNFDNAYYSSINGTGNLYVCGDNGGDATVYQIPVSAGVMSATANPGPVLTSGTDQCSPGSEIYNTSGAVPYDWLFVGVRGDGLASGCSGGACVMGIPLTSWLPSTSYALGQMVVDDHFNIEVVTTAGTSGAGTPSWPAAGSAGTVTGDGSTVKWTSQGPFTFT
ncbi:MAG TPA: hypothetical protein VEN79_07160, partial [Terriglobia bacterium]|nr:hypothetical protein [Terriglobia bacterium]